MMLTQIRIDYQNNETSVKELTQKCTLDNGCLLLTNSIFTNPANECDNDLFKNNVHSYNNDSNR